MGNPAVPITQYREEYIASFEQYYSIRFRNYPVGEEYLGQSEQIPRWQAAGDNWQTGGRQYGET